MEKDFASSVVTSSSEIGASASVSSRGNYGKNLKEQKGKQSSSASSSSRAPVASKSSRSSGGGGSHQHAQQRHQWNRGGDGGSSAAKSTEHGGEVAKAELGSVTRPGSKKGGATCDFAPFYNNKRRGHGGGYRRFDGANESYSHNYGQRNRNSSLCYGPSYNKEQYLQATCQFVVMEGFNYAAHLSDADLLVDWDRIEELRLAADEIPCCPICLYPPSSAKITRCGHVFCWPCILHYLALSDKTWRKCPICYESVYKNQLKSVVTSTVTRFDLGGEITMTLMRREKGSNIVLPASEDDAPPPKKQWELVNGAHAPFSKLLLISREQVIEKVVTRERDELLLKLAEDEHEPEVCFVREALESLDEREKLLKTITKSAADKSPAGSASPPMPLFSPTGLHSKDVFIDAFNDEKRSGGSCSVRSAKSAPATVQSTATAAGRCFNNVSNDECPEDFELAIAATSVSAAINDKFYYFYQAQDGQQIYLHPITARCFIRQYGTLAAAPVAITGEIMDAESFVMTEDTRRRYRYLSHLPLTAAFKLVELKLPNNLLSAETMELFSADFAKREEARQRKAKEEKKRQTQAERWERAVMLDPRNYSKYTTPNIIPPDIPISTFVPSAQRDIQASLSSGGGGAAAPAADTGVTAACSATTPAFPPLLTTGANESLWSTPSFAQMLRHGKPKPLPPPTSSPQLSSSQPGGPNGAADEEQLDEEQREFLHSHALQDTFGDAIQFALDNYRRDSKNVVAAEGEPEVSAATTSNGRVGKKKKKAKGRVLLSM